MVNNFLALFGSPISANIHVPSPPTRDWGLGGWGLVDRTRNGCAGRPPELNISHLPLHWTRLLVENNKVSSLVTVLESPRLPWRIEKDSPLFSPAAVSLNLVKLTYDRESSLNGILRVQASVRSYSCCQCEAVSPKHT